MADLMTRHPALLTRGDTGLIVVDMQEAFRPAIRGFDGVAWTIGVLVQGFGILGAPVLVTEQYPKGLGATVPEIARHLPEGTPVIEKLRFSAAGVEGFDAAFTATGLRRWVVCGIETHVCVHQTVHDLLARGVEVHVATDAVGSRSRGNRRTGVRRCLAAGAHATTAEMCLFEMLEGAGTPEFTAISRLVR